MEPTRTHPGQADRPRRRRAHPARRARRLTGAGSALALVVMTGGMVAGWVTGSTAAGSDDTVQAVGTATDATSANTPATTAHPSATAARKTTTTTAAPARAAIPTQAVTTTRGS